MCEEFGPPGFIPKEPRSPVIDKPPPDTAESAAPQPGSVKILPRSDQFAHVKVNREPEPKGTCNDADLIAVGKFAPGTSLLVPCEVEAQRSWAVVDTGASKSLINSSLATKIEKPIIPHQSKLLGPIGNVMPTRGTLKADVKIGDVVAEDEFVVVDDMYPEVLMGLKFMKENKCDIKVAE